LGSFGKTSLSRGPGTSGSMHWRGSTVRLAKSRFVFHCLCSSRADGARFQGVPIICGVAVKALLPARCAGRQAAQRKWDSWPIESENPRERDTKTKTNLLLLPVITIDIRRIKA
jgi:hypothetical protein